MSKSNMSYFFCMIKLHKGLIKSIMCKLHEVIMNNYFEVASIQIWVLLICRQDFFCNCQPVLEGFQFITIFIAFVEKSS